MWPWQVSQISLYLFMVSPFRKVSSLHYWVFLPKDSFPNISRKTSRNIIKKNNSSLSLNNSTVIITPKILLHACLQIKVSRRKAVLTFFCFSTHQIFCYVFVENCTKTNGNFMSSILDWIFQIRRRKLEADLGLLQHRRWCALW